MAVASWDLKGDRYGVISIHGGSGQAMEAPHCGNQACLRVSKPWKDWSVGFCTIDYITRKSTRHAETTYKSTRKYITERTTNSAIDEVLAGA